MRSPCIIAALTLSMLWLANANVYSQNQTSKPTSNKTNPSKNAGSASSSSSTASTKPANKKLSDLTPEEREELEKQRAEVETTLQCPAQFIVGLALDRDRSDKPNQYNYTGGVWVGTEDSGVYYYQVGTDGKETWTQYTVADGLADNYAYAITCDYLGRVWVGHLNHGVSVFNGEKWQNYDVVTGPLGPRVFAMTTSPVDGDVWIATDAGLSRYSISKYTWTYYTRADGLPSDQIQALAFDKKGTLFVGTQCDGLAISTPLGDYKIWRTVRGPDQMPTAPTGRGLPTNLINCITILPNGNICVGTTTGIAFSRDGGSTWNYIRGKDYAAKVKGLWGGPPKNWKEPTKEQLADLLLEDYITGIAADQNGYVWVTYRQKGYEVIDPITNAKYRSMEDERMTLVDGYISAIQPLPDKQPLIARYGGKLVQFAKKMPSRQRAAYVSKFGLAKIQQSGPTNNYSSLPSMPSVAEIPSADDLTATAKYLQDRIGKEAEYGHRVWDRTLQYITPILVEQNGQLVRKPIPAARPRAVYYKEDWCTQGDWLGRYGLDDTVLFGAGWPWDHYVGRGEAFYKVRAEISPAFRDHDTLRRWLHWESTTNPRCMIDPKDGTRRQAEIDDHGETYRMSVQGPDIWIDVDVPAGTHRLSLYFMNKDGHNSANRWRDYMLRIYPSLPSTYGVMPNSPMLASTRIRDFWGGVYKTFLVEGPCKYLVAIERNYSFNTICSAILLDKISGPRTNLEDVTPSCIADLGIPTSAIFNQMSSLPALQEYFNNSLETARSAELRYQPNNARYLKTLIYRHAFAAKVNEQSLGHFRAELGIFNDDDRQFREKWIQILRQRRDSQLNDNLKSTAKEN